ncbi:hypothetical protein SDC9_186745 [bioreactor metagenome]|uniref:Uncharacterized protein n=1 Tax=bioreactor metagenome TaxID=1076179 RepID=A0A645HJR4_9ZZZZ
MSGFFQLLELVFCDQSGLLCVLSAGEHLDRAFAGIVDYAGDGGVSNHTVHGRIPSGTCCLPLFHGANAGGLVALDAKLVARGTLHALADAFWRHAEKFLAGDGVFDHRISHAACRL